MGTQREEAAGAPHLTGLLQRGAGLINMREEKLGIRLENNILVTRDNPIDLFANIPIELEELMSRRKVVA